MIETEFIKCSCGREKELLYINDQVVLETCKCRQVKRINGLKPIDYFIKHKGDINEKPNRRSNQVSKRSALNS